MKISKSAWYDTFYSNKKILTNYAWYTGVNSLLSRHGDDISSKSVLEIGSGAGEYLNTHNGDYLFGIDISQTALKIARKNSKKAHFLCSKAEQLPFASASFDIVICCEVIEHVDDPRVSMQEMYRVLKPNGTLFLSFPNYYNPIYTLVRLFATVFKKPNLISLQIVDRYLFYNFVIRNFTKNGFRLEDKKGTCYSHQKIPIIRFLNRFESLFDALNLQFLSFHPVLLFRKIN